MKKKSLTAIFACMAVLALTGCQNNTKKSTVSKQSGVGQVRKNSNRKFGHNGSSSSDSNQSLWDSTKQEKLDDFFDDWADTMKQEYDKYDGEGQIKTASGEEFPKDFDMVYLNDQKVSLAYETDGQGSADYNVVAIYNHDNNEGATAGHITYFFAFHDGQPIVLVDETTNGDKVMVKETANKDLINGFNAIAAGKNASMSDSDSDDDDSGDTASAQTEDPKRIGVFVGLLKDGDWFKDGIKGGHMYFGTDWNEKGKMKGYDYITSNGDPTSYFWYKQVGSDVIIKYVDASDSDSVADAPVKTERYAVSRLENDYYVNSGQKAEVNGYVNKLKPISDAD